MNEQLPFQENNFKRKIAYKFRIGEVLSGKQIVDNERLKYIEVGNEKVSRVNLIANVVDKFVKDGEKKFASITLDDATGQIKLKLFGDETSKFEDFNQGDTILVIGLLRSWNNEIYVTPEIVKKKEPVNLIVRKLEVELAKPKSLDKEKLFELKDKILNMAKDAEKDGGVGIDSIILELKEPPELINSEIKKLLEEGMVYEPRPGKLRYLG
ncbi:OB-fold nucleic acid binding domain-containing protein [Candidatus Pacearchaeota archaeon]|nr:OB-fold nucleic acid binding domain-containing protein [Candidatus Pacearchaeota archaeon]